MSSKENRTIRPDFLVHWTGSDIHTDHRNLNKSQRKCYVNRLCSTLHEGLWMTHQEQEIPLLEHGLKYDTAMTCFSEIKLSMIERHTEVYGCLGFGFSRDFILGLFGAPVRYIPAPAEDKITKHFSEAVKAIDALRPPGSNPYFNDIDEKLKPSILFLKPMSKCTTPHDFVYLDESEWRVIYHTASRLAGATSRDAYYWKSRMEGILREYCRVHNGPPEK